MTNDTVDPPAERDAFISHASEDKPFVKQLTDALMRMGISVWYDEYELQVGDSLRGAINAGLSECRYGVVVLSPNFFAKAWPKQELAALWALASGESRILPVLHNMTIEGLRTYDPLLLDVLALSSATGARSVARDVARRIRGPLSRTSAGLIHYRGKSIRLVDVPRGNDDSIVDTRFESCLLQGPAVLFPRGDVTVERCGFNSLDVFWVLEDRRYYAGGIGLQNVEIIECRFKDVGFVVHREYYEELVNLPRENVDIPPHLR